MLKKYAFIFAVAGSCFLGACQNSTSEKAEVSTEAAATSEAADAAASEQLAYICPMKCEGSASHTPGKCPVCSMELVKNPDYKGTVPADSAAL